MQRIVILVVLFIGLSGCGPVLVEDEVQTREPADLREESLMAYNQRFAEYEAQLIEDYISRHRLRMEQSGTGLRYKILNAGKGPRVQKGQKVTMCYQMYLLTGDLMDEMPRSNPLIFTAGKAEVIQGIEEMVSNLGIGGKAKIIVPSHLAYGATGVPGEIPPRASLVIDLEIIDVQ
ncbi:MAG: FKBP-type peptidyl-prolyl cis-trans isomerase [Bacteroidales bacterium]